MAMRVSKPHGMVIPGWPHGMVIPGWPHGMVIPGWPHGMVIPGWPHGMVNPGWLCQQSIGQTRLLDTTLPFQNFVGATEKTNYLHTPTLTVGVIRYSFLAIYLQLL